MKMTPTLIAITGGSGSGKTWLASQLQESLGAERIWMDDFYHDRSHLPPGRRAKINFDHPDALDWTSFESSLSAVARGNTVRLPVYDFETHARLPKTRLLRSSPVVLVEGLWPLRKQSNRRLFALRCFIDCPVETRLHRRLTRDQAERGRTPAEVLRQFCETVAPMHDRYVAPQKRFANFTVHFPVTSATVQHLVDEIRSLTALAALAS